MLHLKPERRQSPGYKPPPERQDIKAWTPRRGPFILFMLAAVAVLLDP